MTKVTTGKTELYPRMLYRLTPNNKMSLFATRVSMADHPRPPLKSFHPPLYIFSQKLIDFPATDPVQSAHEDEKGDEGDASDEGIFLECVAGVNG